MDELQSINDSQPSSSQSLSDRKYKFAQFLGVAVAFLLLLAYFGFKYGVFSFSLEKIRESEREKGKQAAIQAVTEIYTIAEDEPLSDYVSRVCLYVSDDYCMYYSQLSEAEYEKFSKPQSCTVDFIEYLSDIDYTDSIKKGFSFRIMYTVNYEYYDDSIQYDEVIMLIKDDGWKMANLLTYEEYDENTTPK